MEQKLNNLEYSQLTDLIEISGKPLNENEDPSMIIKKLCEKTQLNEDDVMKTEWKKPKWPTILQAPTI